MNKSPHEILKKLTEVYNKMEDIYHVNTSKEAHQAVDCIGKGEGIIIKEL